MNAADPVVSLIMPCYQNRDKLERSIRSVQGQTFEGWELIAVDDGSTDGSLTALRLIAGEEPRLTVLFQEHSGVSAARNRGMRAARGEWIFFLDADDYLTEDAFENLLILAEPGVDILCGAYRLDDSTRSTSEVCTCKNGPLSLIIDSLIRGDSALNSMCARFYRNSMLKNADLVVPEHIAIGEDVLFNLKAFTEASGWKMTDHIVYVYAYGGNSAMTRAKAGGIYEKSLPMLHEIDVFLRQKGLSTAHFHAHIDIWLRTLRADRGRFAAAMAFDRNVVQQVTGGVDFRKLTKKEKLYYTALRACPFLSILLP